MDMQSTGLQALIDKEAIRDLVLLYSRGVDRKDLDLLRDLYTADATDTHGDTYDGPAEGYLQFLAASLPHMRYSGHHVANHMISVDGDEAEGEVYALAFHAIPDAQGGMLEDLKLVRYIDKYRRCEDGRWRFAKRTVTYDYQTRKPIDETSVALLPAVDQDPSVLELVHALFQRGARSEPDGPELDLDRG